MLGNQSIVLRFSKCDWENSVRTATEEISTPTSVSYYSPKSVTQCSKCKFIVVPPSSQCQSCLRFCESSTLSPLLRPFESSFGSSSSEKGALSLDRYLRTAEFLKYVKSVFDSLPSYLRIQDVISTSRQSACSAADCLSYDELVGHLMSLRIEHIQRWLRPLLYKLIYHSANFGVFNKPVDSVALRLPDYHEKISHPMDLGTIRSKLHRGSYDSVEAALADISLVFQNAMAYNESSHPVHGNAKLMKADFDNEVAVLMEKCTRENDRKSCHSCQLCQGSSCLLCGEKCLKFEAPILVCHGSCGQKIKKNAVYYITSDGTVVWCQKCYLSLPPVIGDASALESTGQGHENLMVAVEKKDLLKRKLDEEVAESWVHCEGCGHWIHQVCALYDAKLVEKSMDLPFYCPLCKLEFAVAGAVGCEASMQKKSSARGATSLRKRKSKLALAGDLEESLLETKSVSFAASNHVEIPSLPLQELQELDETSGADGVCSPGGCSPHATSVSSESCTTEVEEIDIEMDVLPTTNDEIPLTDDCSSISKESFPPNFRSKTQQRSDRSSEEEGSTSESDQDEGPAASLLLESSPKFCKLDNSTLPSVPTFARSGSLDSIYLDTLTVEEKLPKSFSRQPRFQLKETVAKNGQPASAGAQKRKWKAADLPRTRLGEFVEAMVKERLRQCGFADAAPSVHVRLVSNISSYMEVPEQVYKNMMAGPGKFVPAALPYNQKCLLLFQTVDGVDVCLFCLYVQEFDAHCPAPNTSVVYIAYLDSVDYFRPMEARTLVYHEILVGYLKFVQMRGFRQAHIWACPPQRGDNFIFWCHPSHQRTPSRDRLTAWYNAMLQRASNLGILSNVTSLWNAYFCQYSRKDKDETTQRQAAKNSFVSLNSSRIAATNLAKAIANSLNPTPATADGGACSTVKLNGEEVPVSPPVFEGDFWVMEAIRIHRSIQQRMKGCDGQDIVFNVRRCRYILKALMAKHLASPFNQPVDPVALNIPDYFKVVTAPMDLGTVRDNLRAGVYHNMLQFVQDVRLTFRNATTFNPVGHPINTIAKHLNSEFESSMSELVKEFAGAQVEADLDKWLEKFPLVVISFSGVVVPANKAKYRDFVGRSYSVDQSECFPPSSPRIGSEAAEAIEVAGSDDGTDQCNVLDADYPNWGFRSNRAFSGPASLASLKKQTDFEKPALGFRGAMSLVADLNKSVFRLKEDMFCITFADPVDVANGLRPVSLKRAKSDSFLDTETVLLSNCTNGGKEIADDTLQFLLSGGGNTGKNPGKRGKGSGKLNSDCLSDTSDEISESCIQLLSNLRPDTTDPDPPISSPFLDSRHTFLEMSQYRHYQFDSLRRAKYSSLMLLHHLLHPQAVQLRPTCSHCHGAIRDLRWHCDCCPGFDLCDKCFHSPNPTKDATHNAGDNPVLCSTPGPGRQSQSAVAPCHEHLLAPYRVTFV